MKEVYIDSLGLPKGARVGLFENNAELDTSAGRADAGLDYANKYLAEKGSLVDFRDTFAEKFAEAFSIPMLTKTKVKKYKDGTEETVEENDETEVEYVNRIRGLAAKGEIPDWPTDLDAINNKLQEFADTLGVFNADASKPVRTPGVKSKQVGKQVLEAATNIFAKGEERIAHWWSVMSGEGVPIATRTGDQAADIKSLARAIKEREERRKKAEYA